MWNSKRWCVLRGIGTESKKPTPHSQNFLYSSIQNSDFLNFKRRGWGWVKVIITPQPPTDTQLPTPRPRTCVVPERESGTPAWTPDALRLYYQCLGEVGRTNPSLFGQRGETCTRRHHPDRVPLGTYPPTSNGGPEETVDSNTPSTKTITLGQGVSSSLRFPKSSSTRRAGSQVGWLRSLTFPIR